LTHGLFVIVLEDGYRVVKREHKNVAQSGRKTTADFSKEAHELDEYPRCRELLKDIHRAFELLKGCKVTHGSIQQDTYVSAFSPDRPGCRDYHLLIQYHAFPLRVPLYAHGSKDFLQPVLAMRHEDTFIKESNQEILGIYYDPFAGYKPGLAADATRFLATRTVTAITGGKTLQVPVQPLRTPNAPLVEQYVQRHRPGLENKTRKVVVATFGGRKQGQNCIGMLNELLRSAATTGRYTFDGEEYPCKLPDHVALCAKGALLRPNFRWDTGDRLNILNAYLRRLAIFIFLL
jgi:hypothetical protein